MRHRRELLIEDTIRWSRGHLGSAMSSNRRDPGAPDRNVSFRTAMSTFLKFAALRDDGTPLEQNAVHLIH